MYLHPQTLITLHFNHVCDVLEQELSQRICLFGVLTSHAGPQELKINISTAISTVHSQKWVYIGNIWD